MLGSGSTWTIGRVWGVEIKAHVSLLLIALLLTLGAAGGLLPVEAPGYSFGIYLVAGLLIAILFIASILIHELAHVWVARQYRLPVIQVILYLFGGVAQVGREPERPAQEFLIAIAGPISSIVLGGLFAAIALISPPGIGNAAASYLAEVNLSLAIFNLLPGFPLDGGRILRSVLWRLERSYTRATRQASRAGQGIAILLGLAGVAVIFRGVGINGFWLILIAFFLFSAASTAFRAVRAEPLPHGTEVRRVMRANVPEIPAEWPLAFFAWRYFDHAADQAYPVMDGESLVGLLTAAQVAPIARTDWGKVRVREAMLAADRVRSVAPDDDLSTALRALDSVGLDYAPVFENGHLIGMLNRRDITYRT